MVRSTDVRGDQVAYRDGYDRIWGNKRRTTTVQSDDQGSAADATVQLWRCPGCGGLFENRTTHEKTVVSWGGPRNVHACQVTDYLNEF